MEFPDWAKDGVCVVTDVHLDWKDRIRVLLRGQLSVKTNTSTENVVGRTETEALVWVPPLRRTKPVGYMAKEEARD